MACSALVIAANSEELFATARDQARKPRHAGLFCVRWLPRLWRILAQTAARKARRGCPVLIRYRALIRLTRRSSRMVKLLDTRHVECSESGTRGQAVRTWAVPVLMSNRAVTHIVCLPKEGRMLLDDFLQALVQTQYIAPNLPMVQDPVEEFTLGIGQWQ